MASSWQNHAKTMDGPKKAWRDPPGPVPKDGEPLALEQRQFQMYDHRPVTLPLAVDPDQPGAHGRVWRIRLNDVPARFEEAQQLAEEGRLHEASKLLIKILEAAQAHHKARRLLYEVSQRINQQLKEKRESKAVSIQKDDNSRAFRSRFYTPSMAQEEIIFGEVTNGKDALEIPLRREGAASPRKSTVPPWIHIIDEEVPQQVSAGMARIDLLRPPPSRGKEAGRLPRWTPPQPPYPRDLHEQLGNMDFPGQEPELSCEDAAEHLDWPAPASESQKASPQNVWHRPDTDAFHSSSQSDGDKESQALPGTDMADYGMSEYRNSPGQLEDQYSVCSEDGSARNDFSRNDGADGGSGVYYQPPQKQVDYQELLKSEYAKLKNSQQAKAMRARIIRTGNVRNILDRETILTNALEAANARQKKFETFAKDKLNQPTKDTGVIHGVGIGKTQEKTAPAAAGCTCSEERELRASTHFIVRMRNAKKKAPRYVPGKWSTEPRF